MALGSTIFLAGTVAHGQESIDGIRKDFSQISEYAISTNKIHSVNTWKVNCDTTGQPTDTLLFRQSFFNSKGRITEERNNFSKDRKEYWWTKYSYNDKGNPVDTTSGIVGRAPFGVFNGVYTPDPPYYLCYKYDKGRIVEEQKNYTTADRKLEKQIFDYNEMGLLSVIKKYIGDRLYEIRIIEYIK